MERIEEVTYLDTHVVIWLFGGQRHRLSSAAIEQIQDEDLLVSPAVVLELQLLHEIKRLRAVAFKVIERLSSEIGLAVCRLPFPSVLEHAVEQSWTRDPFDRLIVAQANANDAALVTKDAEIRGHYKRSIW
ncbi:MAG TPA: type II toxin-antitoxin system VapC family toxin [Bryobacteraceae bacterium]|nr:type II toxin-antitoxin system VapC family toxin [Bryobacteraceae bacterium]